MIKVLDITKKPVFSAGLLHRRGHFDRHKAIRREQVVLADLVDGSNVAVRLGLLIGLYGVDLVALE